MSKTRYAISTIDTLSAYLKAYPNSRLKVIVDVCGADRAAKICQELAGKYVHFPSEKTLRRYALVVLVNEELRYMRDGEEYEKKIAKLARILGKSKSAIKNIHKTKKYCE